MVWEVSFTYKQLSVSKGQRGPFPCRPMDQIDYGPDLNPTQYNHHQQKFIKCHTFTTTTIICKIWRFHASIHMSHWFTISKINWRISCPEIVSIKGWKLLKNRLTSGKLKRHDQYALYRRCTNIDEANYGTCLRVWVLCLTEEHLSCASFGRQSNVQNRQKSKFQ